MDNQRPNMRRPRLNRQHSLIGVTAQIASRSGKGGA